MKDVVAYKPEETKVSEDRNFVLTLIKKFHSVYITDDIYHVFQTFASNLNQPFIPVLNDKDIPISIIIENELKEFAYARYGHELIKRYSIRSFIKEAVIVSIDMSIEEILSATRNIKSCQGVIVTQDRKYLGVMIIEDIISLFEKRHNENKLRMAQLEKFEAIATLAGGVAHDLNNILTPIVGYSELMEMSLKEGEPIGYDMVKEIYIASLRAKQVLSQILAISRHNISKSVEIRLSNVVKESVRFLRSSIPSSIEIEMHILNDCCDLICADPIEISRILLNICTNAYQAMENKIGTIKISMDKCSDHTIKGWSPTSTTSLDSTKEWCCISIEDQGHGIPKSILPKIFEPFFTTKTNKDGTGLGLSVVLSTMNKINGVVSVETEEGKGTIFHLYFPLEKTQKNMCQIQPEQITQKEFSSTKALYQDRGDEINILFVDDETAITRLVPKMLSKYNIKALCENNPLNALEMIKHKKIEFDVLVTDQMMPQMYGVELASKVMAIDPNIPIILCTGYASAISSIETQRIGIREFILKPIDFQKLASIIIRLKNECKSYASNL